MLEYFNEAPYSVTVCDKDGKILEMIYQSPWFKDGEFAGHIELSMEIPTEMPHYVRKPKN